MKEIEPTRKGNSEIIFHIIPCLFQAVTPFLISTPPPPQIKIRYIINVLVI